MINIYPKCTSNGRKQMVQLTSYVNNADEVLITHILNLL